MLKRIRIKGYKSLCDLEVRLEPPWNLAAGRGVSLAGDASNPRSAQWKEELHVG